MLKLTDEQRRTLRASIRKRLEQDNLTRGQQSRYAEKYQVSRQYIYQIVVDERERFRNPVGWEYSKARKRKEVPNLGKLLEENRDHPVFR